MWFQVSGNCMAPLIKKDDLVMAAPLTEPRNGDIVIVAGFPLVVHRVVKVLNGNHLLTKGDVNLTLDRPLARDEVAGKVIAIIRKESKPVLIEGRLWQAGNYLMAKYSLACFLLWDLVSKNKWLVQICRRFSAPLRCIHMGVPRVMAGLAAIQRG